MEIYQVNFLPWRQQQIKKKIREFLLFCYVVCCSVIIACVFLFIFQQIEMKDLKNRKHNNQLQYEQIQQLVLQIATQQTQINSLMSKKRKIDSIIVNNQFLLKLLQNLPTLTPPKSWLTNLQLMNNKIEIKANSYDFQDINSLGLQLKNHPGLSDIQLKKISRVNQLNRLHLTAKYQGVLDE
ncbi:PilN domain-containing protein [Providencia hangzhouensis]|uniref:PilN domain-containing protein n=1 Tax=Providencia hangzhouensis TaxID=3031799 RepID=UPI0034DD2CAC